MIKQNHYLTSTIVAAGLVAAFNALPAQAAEPMLEPEVVTSTFEENDIECASVTLNGNEIISYRGETESGSAEDKAEALADRLEELLEDEKDAIETLMPSHEGNLAAIKSNGKTIVKFELPAPLAENEDGAKLAVKASLQLINALRSAVGNNKYPETLANFAEGTTPGRVAMEGDEVFSGRASWYGPKFHGRKTSNGERFDQEGMTAAHRTLPFGTKLLVTNRSTGKSCVVKVNDRGPYKDNRVIDLSKGAAKQLNMVSSGVAMVDVLVLQ